MKRLMYLFFAAALLILTMCQKDHTSLKSGLKDDVTKLLIYNGTIYKVEKTAIWMTPLLQLPVPTKFNVTPTTQIYLDSVPVTLDKLKPGLCATIYYYVDPTCTSTATGCNIAVKILAHTICPV